MESCADLIPTGLLAMLDGEDEGMMFEELRPRTPQGWQYPQAFPQSGGFGPQSAGMNMLQKLPYIPPQHEGFAPPASGIRDLAYRPEQYPGYPASPFQLLSSQPQQAQGAQAAQEPYYMVGRRPLDIKIGSWDIGKWIYNDEDFGSIGGDHNLRAEHQHFIGSDGSNFGFTDTGEFEEKGREKDYAYDVPNIEKTKFKAKYMDMARLMAREQIEADVDQMKEQMEAFSIEDGEYLVNAYSFQSRNCQAYVDKVIGIARELAKRNGDTLEIT